MKFWLLDISYEVTPEGPEIRLWGIDEYGNRSLVIDRNFLPYFYAIPSGDRAINEVLKEIRSKLAEVEKLELVDRKLFGKPLKAIKVTCKTPGTIPSYAKILSRIKGVSECFMDDIRYSTLYLIDNDVTPCTWHEVRVREIENKLGAKVDKVYLAEEIPKSIEGLKNPKLRVLGFSIVCYSKIGSPKPEVDPVIIISVMSDEDQRQFVMENSDDRVVIQQFINFVQEHDPDIIVSYASNREIFPYLMKRCKLLNVPLLIDRSGSEPHMSMYGHVSITGRAHVDLYDFAEDIPEVKVKTLENVADFLGVKKLSERVHIEPSEVAEYWDDINKRHILMKSSIEDVESIMRISDKLLDFAMQLAALVKIPLDHVGTAAVGFRVENFLMSQASKLQEIIPKRVERPYVPYVGGLVLKPKKGLHENVAVLDVKAMYPSLMIAKNISPDTYVEPNEPYEAYVTPEVGHKFRKEPSGFYKKALSALIIARDKLREDLEKLDHESDEYRILNAKQKAVKVITNAIYGYAGWLGARWYMRQVAEATTAWGRYFVSRMIKIAEKLGLNLIYGDTDSIFLAYEPEKIKEFIRIVREETGLEVKLDKIYTRILFTEAKKRYAGLTKEGWLDIVGLEVVRGDWANIARKVQEHVLDSILREGSLEKSIQCVRAYIEKLKKKEVPYSDLIIWKTLTKRLEDYKVRAPHIEVAKILAKAGMKLTLGDKVGYVIVRGPGSLWEKSKPYMMASYEDLDIEYYINHQIIPTALRVLSIFKVKEEDLKTA